MTQLRKTWFATLAVAIVVAASLFALPPHSGAIAFAPDQGFNWYYWKRPDPDFWSRASAWGSYLAHQFFLWGVIGWAQTHRDRLADRTWMHRVNWLALAGTAGFIALHYLQTRYFYDGLGQDLPVITSQGSVVLLLVVVLLMEAPRRGLFFGSGTGWFAAIRPILLRYHGYYFAWAVTFTYWYHPIEPTAGHILGFLYTFFLFLQAAFIFTRVHSNRVWTFVLEMSVLIHAVVVALVAGQAFWPMFAFGFLFLIVVTQMHGIGLSRAVRWVVALLAVAAMLYVYSGRGWAQMNEVLHIPLIDYAMVFALGGLIMLFRRRAG